MDAVQEALQYVEKVGQKYANDEVETPAVADIRLRLKTERNRTAEAVSEMKHDAAVSEVHEFLNQRDYLAAAIASDTIPLVHEHARRRHAFRKATDALAALAPKQARYHRKITDRTHEVLDCIDDELEHERRLSEAVKSITADYAPVAAPPRTRRRYKPPSPHQSRQEAVAKTLPYAHAPPPTTPPPPAPQQQANAPALLYSQRTTIRTPVSNSPSTPVDAHHHRHEPIPTTAPPSPAYVKPASYLQESRPIATADDTPMHEQTASSGGVLETTVRSDREVAQEASKVTNLEVTGSLATNTLNGNSACDLGASDNGLVEVEMTRVESVLVGTDPFDSTRKLGASSARPAAGSSKQELARSSSAYPLAQSSNSFQISTITESQLPTPHIFSHLASQQHSRLKTRPPPLQPPSQSSPLHPQDDPALTRWSISDLQISPQNNLLRTPTTGHLHEPFVKTPVSVRHGLSVPKLTTSPPPAQPLIQPLSLTPPHTLPDDPGWSISDFQISPQNNHLNTPPMARVSSSQHLGVPFYPPASTPLPPAASSLPEKPPSDPSFVSSAEKSVDNPDTFSWTLGRSQKAAHPAAEQESLAASTPTSIEYAFHQAEPTGVPFEPPEKHFAFPSTSSTAASALSAASGAPTAKQQAAPPKPRYPMPSAPPSPAMLENDGNPFKEPPKELSLQPPFKSDSELARRSGQGGAAPDSLPAEPRGRRQQQQQQQGATASSRPVEIPHTGAQNSLPDGTAVVLHSFVQEAEYNGSSAVVLGRRSVNGYPYVLVQVDRDGKKKLVKERNTAKITDPRPRTSKPARVGETPALPRASSPQRGGAVEEESVWWSDEGGDAATGLHTAFSSQSPPRARGTPQPQGGRRGWTASKQSSDSARSIRTGNHPEDSWEDHPAAAAGPPAQRQQPKKRPRNPRRPPPGDAPRSEPRTDDESWSEGAEEEGEEEGERQPPPRSRRQPPPRAQRHARQTRPASDRGSDAGNPPRVAETETGSQQGNPRAAAAAVEEEELWDTDDTDQPSPRRRPSEAASQGSGSMLMSSGSYRKQAPPSSDAVPQAPEPQQGPRRASNATSSTQRHRAARQPTKWSTFNLANPAGVQQEPIRRSAGSKSTESRASAADPSDHPDTVAQDSPSSDAPVVRRSSGSVTELRRNFEKAARRPPPEKSPRRPSPTPSDSTTPPPPREAPGRASVLSDARRNLRSRRPSDPSEPTAVERSAPQDTASHAAATNPQRVGLAEPGDGSASRAPTWQKSTGGTAEDAGVAVGPHETLQGAGDPHGQNLGEGGRTVSATGGEEREAPSTGIRGPPPAGAEPRQEGAQATRTVSQLQARFGGTGQPGAQRAGFGRGRRGSPTPEETPPQRQQPQQQQHQRQQQQHQHQQQQQQQPANQQQQKLEHEPHHEPQRQQSQRPPQPEADDTCGQTEYALSELSLDSGFGMPQQRKPLSAKHTAPAALPGAAQGRTPTASAAKTDPLHSARRGVSTPDHNSPAPAMPAGKSRASPATPQTSFPAQAPSAEVFATKGGAVVGRADATKPGGNPIEPADQPQRRDAASDRDAREDEPSKEPGGKKVSLVQARIAALGGQEEAANDSRPGRQPVQAASKSPALQQGREANPDSAGPPSPSGHVFTTSLHQSQKSDEAPTAQFSTPEQHHGATMRSDPQPTTSRGPPSHEPPSSSMAIPSKASLSSNQAEATQGITPANSSARYSHATTATRPGGSRDPDLNPRMSSDVEPERESHAVRKDQVFAKPLREAVAEKPASHQQPVSSPLLRPNSPQHSISVRSREASPTSGDAHTASQPRQQPGSHPSQNDARVRSAREGTRSAIPQASPEPFGQALPRDRTNSENMSRTPQASVKTPDRSRPHSGVPSVVKAEPANPLSVGPRQSRPLSEESSIAPSPRDSVPTAHRDPTKGSVRQNQPAPAPQTQANEASQPPKADSFFTRATSRPSAAKESGKEALAAGGARDNTIHAGSDPAADKSSTAVLAARPSRTETVVDHPCSTRNNAEGKGEPRHGSTLKAQLPSTGSSSNNPVLSSKEGTRRESPKSRGRNKVAKQPGAGGDSDSSWSDDSNGEGGPAKTSPLQQLEVDVPVSSRVRVAAFDRDPALVGRTVEVTGHRSIGAKPMLVVRTASGKSVLVAPSAVNSAEPETPPEKAGPRPSSESLLPAQGRNRAEQTQRPLGNPSSAAAAAPIVTAERIPSAEHPRPTSEASVPPPSAVSAPSRQATKPRQVPAGVDAPGCSSQPASNEASPAESRKLPGRIPSSDHPRGKASANAGADDVANTSVSSAAPESHRSTTSVPGRTGRRPLAEQSPVGGTLVNKSSLEKPAETPTRSSGEAKRRPSDEQPQSGASTARKPFEKPAEASTRSDAGVREPRPRPSDEQLHSGASATRKPSFEKPKEAQTRSDAGIHDTKPRPSDEQLQSGSSASRKASLEKPKEAQTRSDAGIHDTKPRPPDEQLQSGSSASRKASLEKPTEVQTRTGAGVHETKRRPSDEQPHSGTSTASTAHKSSFEKPTEASTRSGAGVRETKRRPSDGQPPSSSSTAAGGRGTEHVKPEQSALGTLPKPAAPPAAATAEGRPRTTSGSSRTKEAAPQIANKRSDPTQQASTPAQGKEKAGAVRAGTKNGDENSQKTNSEQTAAGSAVQPLNREKATVVEPHPRRRDSTAAEPTSERSTQSGAKPASDASAPPNLEQRSTGSTRNGGEDPSFPVVETPPATEMNDSRRMSASFQHHFVKRNFAAFEEEEKDAAKEFVPGSKVIIDVAPDTHPALKGSTAKVVALAGDGKLLVVDAGRDDGEPFKMCPSSVSLISLPHNILDEEFSEDDAAEAEPAEKPPPSLLPKGTPVVLHSLLQCPQLNGATTHVLDHQKTAAGEWCYVVSIGGFTGPQQQQQQLLRPDNVRAIQPGAAEAPRVDVQLAAEPNPGFEQRYPIGSSATLQNFQSRQQLNGTAVEITGHRQASGETMVAVRMPDGKQTLVRESNLQLGAPSESSGEGGLEDRYPVGTESTLCNFDAKTALNDTRVTVTGHKDVSGEQMLVVRMPNGKQQLVREANVVTPSLADTSKTNPQTDHLAPKSSQRGLSARSPDTHSRTSRGLSASNASQQQSISPSSQPSQPSQRRVSAQSPVSPSQTDPSQQPSVSSQPSQPSKPVKKEEPQEEDEDSNAPSDDDGCLQLADALPPGTKVVTCGFPFGFLNGKRAVVESTRRTLDDKIGVVVCYRDTRERQMVPKKHLKVIELPQPPPQAPPQEPKEGQRLPQTLGENDRTREEQRNHDQEVHDDDDDEDEMIDEEEEEEEEEDAPKGETEEKKAAAKEEEQGSSSESGPDTPPEQSVCPPKGCLVQVSGVPKSSPYAGLVGVVSSGKQAKGKKRHPEKSSVFVSVQFSSTIAHNFKPKHLKLLLGVQAALPVLSSRTASFALRMRSQRSAAEPGR
ncbi:hypothetical protein DIPPA_05411 [Diplonema papillatum]|nr:hypothetical protein DIPPA_05411 [Diplonema papillatum]